MSDASKALVSWINERFDANALNAEVKSVLLKTTANIFVRTNRDTGKIDYPLPVFTKELTLHLLATQPDLFSPGVIANSPEGIPPVEVNIDSLERVYMEDALDVIQATTIPAIRKKYPEIWELHSHARSFTIFYYTVAQMREKENGVSQAIIQHFRDDLKALTPLMQYPDSDISFNFDTKENVDENAGGDFSTYYR